MELCGTVPGLNVFQAKTYLTRAYAQNICNSGRQWSFQVGDAGIFMPAPITAGAFAITTGSANVTANATAIAALAGLTNPTIVFRQIRFGGTFPYNIVTYNPVSGAMTLDRPVVDVTAAASAYTVYQCFYPAPVSDFKRWVTLEDPVNGYDLELDHTRQEVDLIDPQRQSTDMPYWVVSYKQGSSTAGPGSMTAPLVPYLELWPSPTTGGQLVGTFNRIGTSLFAADADVLPIPLTDALLIEYAKGWHVYPWAMANAGRVAGFDKTNWGFLITDAKNAVNGVPGTNQRGLLNDAKREDDEIFNRSRIFKRPRARNSYQGPIDARFFQSHGTPPRTV